jgi:phage terminase large subunit-like protein
VRQRIISRKKDPATHYAQKVERGDIIAGPHVRHACARHLRDLKEGPKRGLRWDVELSKRAIGFYSDVLHLNGGEFEGVPYDLLTWQEFIVGSLLGWLDADSVRRFRTAYVETGKGSGKSPLAAGVGLYGLVADGENRAEIYAAATKKDQAMILFRDAVAMVDLSPELGQRVRKSGADGKTWNLAYLDTMSYFRTIASGDGQSGPRPHFILLDEIHEHRDGRVIEMLRAGTKGRRQALSFMITNSGSNRQSVCYEYHDYAAQVSAGVIEDDSFFGYVCALDEGDDPFEDESCWPKANPSLGITIQKKYLREQVREARGMPSKESVVKRLNFCMWVEALSPWLSYDAWKACEKPYTAEDLRGRRCVGGLDLGSTTDLTGLVLAFEPTEEDPITRLLAYCWLPEIGLKEKEKKDRVPYLVWKEKGYLETSPGKAISKLFVLRRLVQLMDMFEISTISFDRWRVEDLKVLAEDEGITLPEMIPFGQGYKDMAPAIDETERMLLNEEVSHNGHPILTWCAANAVIVTDPAGNRKLSKEKAVGRIDLMVATVMAVGCDDEEITSAYDDRGVMVF